MEYIIREEQPKDFDQVRTILRSTFPTEAESNLVDELRVNGKALISLVAVNGDEIVGHVLFSPVTTSPPGDANGIGLAPVAVRLDMQAQGIGSKLVLAGLDLCRKSGFDYCVVLGDPGYYQRFGFGKASLFGLDNEYEVDDAFMVIRFSECGLAGLVQYAPEFRMFSV